MASTDFSTNLEGYNLESRTENLGTAEVSSDSLESAELEPAAEHLTQSEQKALEEARHVMSSPPKDVESPTHVLMHRHLLHSRGGGSDGTEGKQDEGGERRAGKNATEVGLATTQSPSVAHDTDDNNVPDPIIIIAFGVGGFVLCIAIFCLVCGTCSHEDAGDISTNDTTEESKESKSPDDTRTLALSSDSDYSNSSEEPESCSDSELGLVQIMPSDVHPAQGPPTTDMSKPHNLPHSMTTQLFMWVPGVGNAAQVAGNVVNNGAQAVGDVVKNGVQAVGNVLNNAPSLTLPGPYTQPIDVQHLASSDPTKFHDFVSAAPSAAVTVHTGTTSAPHFDHSGASKGPSFVGPEKMHWKFGDGVRMELPLTDAALLAQWKTSNGRIHYKENTNMKESMVYVIQDGMATSITVKAKTYLRSICVETTTTHIKHEPNKPPTGARVLGEASPGCTRFEVQVSESQLPGWILRGNYSTQYEVSQDGKLVATWEEDIAIGAEWDPRVLQGSLGGSTAGVDLEAGC